MSLQRREGFIRVYREDFALQARHQVRMRMLTRVNIEQVINKECGGLRSNFEGRSSSSGTLHRCLHEIH